jgi:membrane protease YdiL (CAAX protease family)
MTRKDIVSFYLLAFTTSWLIWVPEALYDVGLVADNAWIAFFRVNRIGAYGPLFAAIIMSIKNGSLKSLLSKGFSNKYNKKWLLPSIILPTLFAIALQIGKATGYSPEFMSAGNPAMLIIIPLWIFVLGGPLQEEFGWRGYALPRILEKYNGLTAGIITGSLWGLWHIPLFFIKSEGMYYNEPMWGLLISTILLSILMVWIYNHVESLFPLLVFHTAFNSSHALIPVLGNDTSSLWYMILLFAFTAVIVIRYGVDLKSPVYVQIKSNAS